MRDMQGRRGGFVRKGTEDPTSLRVGSTVFLEEVDLKGE